MQAATQDEVSVRERSAGFENIKDFLLFVHAMSSVAVGEKLNGFFPAEGKNWHCPRVESA